jgi:DNA ligase 1
MSRAVREKPVVMKADDWDWDADPRGWLATEKYNGWRAWLDSSTGRLRTGTGHVYAAPAEWLAKFPKVPLDGELWLGRGRGMLQRLASIVSRGLDGPPVTGLEARRWDAVQFVVFDLKDTAAGPTEERRRILESAVLAHPVDRLQLVPETLVKGRDHLDAMVEAVMGIDGEGIMLRKPGSGYAERRVPWLLKVKKWATAEARVTGYQAGERGCAGMMGALVCRMGRDGSGVEFEIGTGFSNDERRNPPPKGSLVRFRYEELSAGGNPLKPSYRGIRHEAE